MDYIRSRILLHEITASLSYDLIQMSSTVLRKRIIENIQNEQQDHGIHFTADHFSNITSKNADKNLTPVMSTDLDIKCTTEGEIASKSLKLMENSQPLSFAAIINDAIPRSITDMADTDANNEVTLRLSASKNKKIWMKVGGSRKEPRVGSDFQVDL